VGALVTGSLALLAAAMDSWAKVASVFVFGIVYAQIESAYLTPRIMRTSVNLTGTAVIVALLLGVSFAGVAGAMVAVPTAVLVAVLVEEYVTHAPERDPPA
jgi:predicted PurR-regulated permease PerM